MVDHDEPFTRLLTQGMVLKDGAVMSKSKGNVVDPDDMIGRYGADALRLYIMFVAPPEKEIEWTDEGLLGSYRFLHRVWRIVDVVTEALEGEGAPAPASLALNDAERRMRRQTHETIQSVTTDLDPRVHLNTAVSALMVLVNELYRFCDQVGIAPERRRDADASPVVLRLETKAVLRETVQALVLMISPFTPHLAEELWERLGNRDGLATAPWPVYDPVVGKPEEIVVPVQVNGRLRARLTVAADTSETELEALALADPHVRPHLDGKPVKKVVVAKGKLVNVVV
jgi:leucyl-tRNA synthetase